MILSIIIAVVAVVGSVVMQKKMEQDMKDQQAGFLVSKSGGSNPLRIIYGKRRISTDTIWKDSSHKYMAQDLSEADSYHVANSEVIVHGGTSATAGNRRHKDYLHRLDAWCQGPIESILNIKVDDDVITHPRLSVGGPAPIRVLNKHGADSQEMFTSLVTNQDEISADMKGQNVAYSWSRFYYDIESPEYQGEPTLTAEIKGTLVWDPRVNPSDPSIKAWSTNPALCLLDYLTASYGRNLDVADIELDSFIAGANSCDAVVALPAETVVVTGGDYYNPTTGEYHTLAEGDTYTWHRYGQAVNSAPRYSCNVVLESTNSTKDNAQEILKCMKGSLPFIQGKYKLVLEEPGSSVMSFNNDNILGTVSIGFADRAKRLGRCTVKFPNANKGYKPDTISWPAAYSTLHNAYMANDNGDDLHTEVELTGVTDLYQARDLAEFMVRDSRTQEFITFKAQPSALVLECGDLITVTNDILDITNKVYRVRTMTMNADLTVDIKAQEYDPSVYPWNLTDEDSEAVALEQAPTAFDTPSPITSLQAMSVTESNTDGTASARIVAVWEQLESNTAAPELIEIGFQQGSESVISWVTLPPEAQAYAWVGLPDNTPFTVYARYKNSFGRFSATTSAAVTTPTANTEISATDQTARTSADDALLAASAAQATAGEKIYAFYEPSYIQSTSVIGPELVENGSFTGSSTYNGDVSTFTGVDGTISSYYTSARLVEDDNINPVYAYIPITTVPGKDYQMKVDKYYGQFSVRLSVSTTKSNDHVYASTPTSNSNSIELSQYFTARSETTYVLFEAINSSVGQYCGFDNVSVKEVSPTRWQPTANAIGDLWVDTADNNKLFRWSGSAWQSAQDGSTYDALVGAASAAQTAVLSSEHAQDALVGAAAAEQAASLSYEYAQSALGTADSAEQAAWRASHDAQTALNGAYSADQTAWQSSEYAQQALDAAKGAVAVAALAQTEQEVLSAIAADTTQINGARIITGTVNAADITATTELTVGTSQDVAKVSGSDSNYRIWVGHTQPNSAPFKVAKDGAVTIKSATTGERLEIVSDRIKVYDSTGQLRVQLGDLS